MSCGAMILIAVACMAFVFIKSDIETKERKAENKSGSVDYVYNKEEKANEIAGSNLDRFFIECVLSNANDFSKAKNAERAKLLAKKYNLSYPNGIEKLYDKAYEAHMKITGRIQQEKETIKHNKEKKEYNELIKYAEYYGREKRKAILTDQMVELKKTAAQMDMASKTIIRNTQQRESDWAVWGGIASGLAGTGAGVATALEMQANNAKIRAQNEANMKAAMPAYMYMSYSASENRKHADEIQREIESLNEKLMEEPPAKEIMEMLEIYNETIDISSTGAFKVTATAKCNKKLFIYEDVPAVIDGTVIAHIYDGGKEVASTKIVLPVNGVSAPVGIIGAGLEGLTTGKNYTVKFSEYKLWLIEK